MPCSATTAKFPWGIVGFRHQLRSVACTTYPVLSPPLPSQPNLPPRWLKLANGMRLAMLAAQRVLLVGEMLVHAAVAARLGAVGLHVLGVLLEAGLVHLHELRDRELEVGDEGVAPST